LICWSKFNFDGVVVKATRILCCRTNYIYSLFFFLWIKKEKTSTYMLMLKGTDRNLDGRAIQY
jgi:hypothetical protein